MIYSLLLIVLMLARPPGAVHTAQTRAGRAKNVMSEVNQAELLRIEQCHHPLRRPDGRLESELRHRRERIDRPDRPQWRRQNHCFQSDHRRVSPDRRRHHISRPLDCRPQAATKSLPHGIARTFQNIRLFPPECFRQRARRVPSASQAAASRTRSARASFSRRKRSGSKRR